MTKETVPFGYREVTPAEKKRLVRAEFDEIARAYDFADTVLSFGLDSRWRKNAVSLLGVGEGDFVLDACGGTAGLARLVARPAGPAGQVVVYDFSRAMMEVGESRARGPAARAPIGFVQGDTEDLSFPGGTFDAVTIGFGLRNLAHPAKGLGEFLRVLKPGGKLMVIEFSLPVNRFFRALYHAYSFCWMPLAGRLICRGGGSFRYLAESIRVFPAPEEIAENIREAGFDDVLFRRLSGGIAVVYLGVKPPSCPEFQPANRPISSGRGS
ncbi:MAG: class I SAM-dependent methyltransferase [Candidatus Aminicenantales bacterium]